MSGRFNEAIDKLKPGIGFDFVHTNHVQFSSIFFRNFMSRLFSCFLSHSFIPKQMLYGQIRPIVKNNSMCKTNSDNYRPIMNSSVFLKLFEYILLPTLTSNLDLNGQQFGFQKGLNCNAVITLLKETVLSHNKRNSNVHCAFLDLTKTFDKINIDILTSIWKI